MPEFATVNVNMLNLRQQPGTTYAVLQRLPYGTRVEILSDSTEEWVQVRVERVMGYVAGAFITVDTKAPVTPDVKNPLLDAYLAQIPEYDLPDGYRSLWKNQPHLGLPDPFEVLPVQLQTEREVQRFWLNGFGPNYFAFMYWSGWYTGTAGMHSGFDYMVKQNTPLLAVGDGVIIQGWRFLRSPYDKTVVLWCFLPEQYRDAQGRRMMSNVLVAYAHMNNNTVRRHLEPVSAGDIIGYSGTPNGTGSNAHLHFELHLLEGDPFLPYPRQPETRQLKEYRHRQLQNNNTPWNSTLFFTPRLVNFFQHQDKLFGHAGKAPGYPTAAMLKRAGVRTFPPLDLFSIAYFRYGMPIVWNNLTLAPEKGVLTSDLLNARLKIFPPFEPYEAWFL